MEGPFQVISLTGDYGLMWSYLSVITTQHHRYKWIDIYK